MLSISEVIAGVSTIEKFLPVVEKVGSEIGPVVQAEIADGKQIWTDVEKAFADFKGAIAAVKAAASSVK